jgi:hypothetical protein
LTSCEAGKQAGKQASRQASRQAKYLAENFSFKPASKLRALL